MTSHPNDSKVRVKLRHRIQAAANQLAAHKQAARWHYSALGFKLKAALTSPGMLLFAGSTGFVIGEFAGRNGNAPGSGHSRGARHSSMTGVRRAIRFALKVYSVAHTVTGLMGGEPPQRSRNRAPLPSA